MKHFVLPVALFFAVVLAVPAQKKSGIDTAGIDTTCKPCDDFWRFASGKWMESNPIPPSQSGWGPMSAMNDQNRERLKVLLDQAALSKVKGSNEKKIGDLYGACMDVERAEKLGWQPIAKDLIQIDQITDAKSLAAFLKRRQIEQPLGPFGLGASPDVKNTESTIVGVGPGGISLPERDYYFKDDARTLKIREEFVAHVGRMLKLLGKDQDPAVAAKQILDFETQMAKPMLTNVARRDPYASYHPVGLKGLTELTPAIDWKGIMEGLGVPAGTQVNVAQPDYMTALQKLIQETPVDTWKLWLRWKVTSGAASELSKAFVDEDFQFFSVVLNGVKEQQPRWKRCANIVDRSMGDALGELFVKKHFPPAAKQKMLEMVENLRAVIRDEITNSSWMTPDTRKNALAKLEAFRPKIGYPDHWRDYSNVTIDRDDLLASLRSASAAARKHQLAKIGQPRDRNDWGMTPPTVNAYYSPTQNEIAFPAGILQPPLFDLDADDAVNYGAAGAVIGHEMGHGFDDQGAKFAANGNLENWWTDDDKKKFEARAACVIDQYNTIDVGEGQRHKGQLVVGEAMGDLGGLHIAFRAYQNSLKGKESPKLDGYTGEQRFFLSFARVWATQLRPESMRLRLATDPHPIARWRAIGTLQNMPEFHQAFNCKQGDFMVRPVDKQCKVW